MSKCLSGPTLYKAVLYNVLLLLHLAVYVATLKGCGAHQVQEFVTIANS